MSALARIHFDALRGNAAYFKSLLTPPCRLLVVVKANGYGHGVIAAAEAALAGGAGWLSVARSAEAFEVRENLKKKDVPLLVMGVTHVTEDLVRCVAQDVSITIDTVAGLRAVEAAAARAGKTARLHVKVDTGMSRLGANAADGSAVGLCREVLGSAADVKLEGVFTHFARADEPELPGRAEMKRASGLFLRVKDELERDVIPSEQRVLFHACNSAATMRYPEMHLDMVRVGIAYYGLKPSPDFELPAELRPGLEFVTQLTHVKWITSGTGVSYGHKFVLDEGRPRMRVGTCAVGYADGFRRADGNVVYVRGKPCPVLGRVCMDQIVVDLSALDDDPAPGEEVVLIGAHTPASALAACWGTIDYEVTCGLLPRVERVLV